MDSRRNAILMTSRMVELSSMKYTVGIRSEVKVAVSLMTSPALQCPAQLRPDFQHALVCPLAQAIIQRVLLPVPTPIPVPFPGPIVSNHPRLEHLQLPPHRGPIHRARAWHRASGR